MNFFLALLIAHFFGDILFNVSFLSRSKRSDNISDKVIGVTSHCLIHAASVFIVFYVLNLDNILMAASMVFLCHSLIDLVRPCYEKKLIPKSQFIIMKKTDIFRWLSKKGKGSDVDQFMKNYFFKWVLVNICDQSLHLISLLVISLLINS